jgi:hypothetical protein
MPSDRFEVDLTRDAERDLQRLRPHIDRAAMAIAQLESNPYLGHTLTGSLKGARSLEFSLPGSGAHRAIYFVIEDERLCVVLMVGPHENIYDKAERRAKAVKKAYRI